MVQCLFASNKDLDDEIIQPLYDDINTPGYIANLHKLYDKANKGNDEDKQIFNSACNFIGLLQETKEEWLNYKKEKQIFQKKKLKIK
jgi:cysteinyl-tRNA synthetase